jgi:hypothetical protein
MLGENDKVLKMMSLKSSGLTTVGLCHDKEEESRCGKPVFEPCLHVLVNSTPPGGIW